jgi:hypothetical protein
LGEDGADRGSDPVGVALGDLSEHVAQEVTQQTRTVNTRRERDRILGLQQCGGVLAGVKAKP